MLAGRGGPTKWDTQDGVLMRENPDLSDQYYTAHNNVRISRLVDFDKRIASLTKLVQALLIDVAHLKVEECAKLAGESKGRGSSSGRKPARPMLSSSSKRGKSSGSKAARTSPKAPRPSSG